VAHGGGAFESSWDELLPFPLGLGLLWERVVGPSFPEVGPGGNWPPEDPGSGELREGGTWTAMTESAFFGGMV
jgi:hypothetical protein